MALSATNSIEKLLGYWLHVVQKNAWLFLLASLAFTVFNVSYIKNNLGINTDTSDMLSEDLQWRKNQIKFTKTFPQFSDNIAIVIESDTPDQTQDAAITLTEALDQKQNLFPSVFQIENSAFFRQNSLLYLDTEELEDLADDLAAVQPFLAKLQEDQNLRGLFSVLTQALKEKDQDVDLDQILNAIDQTIAAHLDQKSQRMSWHKLMSGREITIDDKRAVITVQPKLDYSELLPGKPAVDALRSIISDINLEENYGVKVRLTGGVALSYEELDSVSRGAQAGGLIALFAVAVILIAGLRSLSLVVATLVTLVIGLIWTAAFAAVAIGELNMISVAFMVLYIGLGVDFAIHLCLRYREQRLEGLEQKTAVRESGQHIGASLLLCAFTTAIGFYAFLPTAYSGVAELGLISGTGMFISLFLSLTVLPALLTLLPYNPKPHNIQNKKPSNLLIALQKLPLTHTKQIIIAATILGIFSLILLPRVHFDHNPIHLMDPETESVQTFQDLLANSSRSPLSINIVQDQIGDLPAQLEALDSVEDVITINNFIPADQDEKLAIIEDLALIMSLQNHVDQKSISDQERLESIKQFSDVLKTRQPDQKLNQTLAELFDQNTPELVTQDWVTLEKNLTASLPGRLNRLEESLEAEEIKQDSLPVDLYDRWHSADQFRIEVFPKEDLDNNQALETFVSEVVQIAPNATGTPVINFEASKAVIKAFQQAFGLAILVITILLWLLLDKKSDSLLILVTLILAGLLTCAVTVLLGIQFNFANIIALPLLLGIGVDSAIHILHRYRTALPDNGLLLNTSTARAVLFSALTTACSFGNLAISPHKGTASMGVILTIGLILTLVVTLFVLPALLKITDQKL